MMPLHRSRGLPALLCLLLAAGCRPNSTDLAVRQLSARMDSLAFVLDGLRKGGGDGEEQETTATVSLHGAATLGSADAPVTIVEFTDYQCPYCRRHAHTTLPELAKSAIASGQVRYVLRDLPLDIHPWAEKFARGARCAGKIGNRYWEFHDSLFASTTQQSEKTTWRVAHQLGLDSTAFSACLTSKEIEQAVAADRAEANARSMSRTPSFVVGVAEGDSVRGVVIGGAYPMERFNAAIQQALKTRPQHLSLSPSEQP